jgi:type II secretory pathway pseudopilin PulG
VREERVKIRKASGFALIDLVFVCGIIGLISSIAVPRLVLAKQAAGAASAIGTLRTVSSAQLAFALTCGNGFYAPDLPSLGIPPPGSNDPFIAQDLSAAAVIHKSGYTFRLEGLPFTGAPPTCNGLAGGAASQGYRAAADPLEPDNPRYFGINANSQLYTHTATLYDDMPEVGEPLIGQPIH